MDDPRLSNYFASTGASGKNRYGSSLRAARGISWEPSMVSRRGGGRRWEFDERSQEILEEKLRRALSIFLFFPVAAQRGAARLTEAARARAHSSCFNSWNFPFLVGSSHESRERRRTKRKIRNEIVVPGISTTSAVLRSRKVPTWRLELLFSIHFLHYCDFIASV